MTPEPFTLDDIYAAAKALRNNSRRPTPRIEGAFGAYWQGLSQWDRVQVDRFNARAAFERGWRDAVRPDVDR